MREHEAPFYLRRTKEALVTFPHPDTGEVRKLFTKREVRTAAFDLDGEELDFYDELTRYVEDQSMAAAGDDSARGRAVGFTMAMLQRRMASSVYAVRRSLERMRDRREKILEDPEAYRQEQIERRMPDDFDDLTEEEQQRIIGQLEDEVLSVDPAVLREEIGRLTQAYRSGQGAWRPATQQSKLNRAARRCLTEQGIFADPKMRLLIFTEHKDTLDYLAGDGQDERPLGKLREWGLTLTQIHGGMKIGDRDTPGSRIYAEREFKESAQVLVATEAAGEGINLQFCWLMINFDIPWNPVRLEQRVGRIHRYGQEKDCLVFNFVAQNTREGRVLQKLIERLHGDSRRPGQRPGVRRRRRRLPVEPAGEAVPRHVRPRHGRAPDSGPHRPRRQPGAIPGHHRKRPGRSGQEGTEPLGHRRQVGRGQGAAAGAGGDRAVLRRGGARDRAAPRRRLRKASGVYRIGKVPRNLLPIGDRQEARFGRLGREYGKIVFDKTLLPTDPTLEWVTPGHPLFEAVRTDCLARCDDHLRRGGVFFDLHRDRPALLDVFAASIKDGRGSTLHRRLFVVETAQPPAGTTQPGEMLVHEPTILHEVTPAPIGTPTPADLPVPDRTRVEQFLYQRSLEPWIAERSKGPHGMRWRASIGTWRSA